MKKQIELTHIEELRIYFAIMAAIREERGFLETLGQIDGIAYNIIERLTRLRHLKNKFK